jgi:cell wall-associated NlpC family hydrolase
VIRLDVLRAGAGARLLGGLALLAAAGCATGAPPPDPVDRPMAHRSASRSRVVATALKYVGAPYARGGSSPAGFDCSGFVMFVYRHVGVSLPHNAEKQYRLGSPVRRDRLEPGDLVFFDRLGHSGIYIGRGRFVHATKPGDVVKVSELDERWYRHRWVGARRLF